MQTASCEAHYYKVHITGEGWLPRSPGQSHHLNEWACISRLIYLTEWSQSTGECASKKKNQLVNPFSGPKSSRPLLSKSGKRWARVWQQRNPPWSLRLHERTSERVGGTSSGSVSTQSVIIWGFWRIYCGWRAVMLA